MGNPTMSRIRWLLVLWLFVLSAVAYLDRVNISVAGELLARDYHLSKIQLGWIFSAFLAGYALFQTAGGRLADALGPRRVLAMGVGWWALFTALTAAVPASLSVGLPMLMGVRFALGAGESVIYPASNQVVACWLPSHERGLANGLIFAGVGVGAGLTPPLITYIMLQHGWRSSFLLCALIGLLAGGLWYVVARDSPEHHPLVRAQELAHIRSGLSASPARGGAPRLPWVRLLESRDILAMTVSYFAFGYVAWIFFSWFYIYLAEVRGLNLKSSALYSMLPFVAMAICSPLGGMAGDALVRRGYQQAGRVSVAVIGMTSAAGFLALGATVENAHVAAIVLAGGAGALYLAQSSFWSVTADIGGASCGYVSGFMNMGNQLGGMITASVTPWLAARFGWNAAFAMAGALCLFGAMGWRFVDPRRRLAAVDPDHSII